MSLSNSNFVTLKVYTDLIPELECYHFYFRFWLFTCFIKLVNLVLNCESRLPPERVKQGFTYTLCSESKGYQNMYLCGK